jgi:hypothetical protein
MVLLLLLVKVVVSRAREKEEIRKETRFLKTGKQCIDI